MILFVEHIWLFGADDVVERLEAEPTPGSGTDLALSQFSDLGTNELGLCPAASASSCAWHERSMVMYHHATLVDGLAHCE